MADDTLEILIKTKADLAAANAVKKSLEDQILKTKLLGGEFKGLQAQLDLVNGHINKFTEANKDAGGESKLFAGHMGEVRHAVRELSGEFPIAGLALRLFTNLIGGTVTAAIVGFGLAKKALTEWDEEMEKQIEIARKPDFTTAMEGRRAAIESARLEAEKFTETMAHLDDPISKMQRGFDAVLNGIKEQFKGQNETLNAQQQLELAKLEEKHKLMLISEADYITQKAAIEERGRQAAIQREAEQAQRIITVKDAQLNSLIDHQKRDAAGVPGAQSAAKAAELAAQQKEGDIKDLTAKQADLDEDARKARKEWDEAHQSIDAARRAGPAAGNWQREHLATLDAATGLADANRAAIAGLRPGAIDARSAANTAARAESRAQDQSEAGQKKIDTLTEELANLKRDQAIKDAAARATGSVQGQTAAVKTKTELEGTDEGKQFADFSRIQGLLDAHQRLNADDAKLYSGLMPLILQLAAQHKDVLGNITILAHHMGDAKQQLDALARLVKELQSLRKSLLNQ